jgi:PEP-CTERM motif
MFATRIKTALLAAIAFAGVSTQAHPASITLDATARGWYDSAGNFSGSDNYIAGRIGAVEFRNFFRFDLSAVTESVISATLRLFNPDVTGAETYEVNQYSGSVASLIGGTGGLAAFADLGDGALLGTANISVGDGGSYTEITLDGAALALIDAAGSSIAFGGWLSSLGIGGAEYVFGFSGGGNMSETQLILETSGIPTVTVPEPGTLGLILGGLGMLGWRLRRRA